MPNLKGWELLILIAVLVLLFGAKKLPDAARGMGRSLRIFKAETKGLMDDEAPAVEGAPAAGAVTAAADAAAAQQPVAQPAPVQQVAQPAQQPVAQAAPVQQAPAQPAASAEPPAQGTSGTSS